MKKEKTMDQLVKEDKIVAIYTDPFLYKEGQILTFVEYDANDPSFIITKEFGRSRWLNKTRFKPYEEDKSVTQEEMSEIGKGPEQDPLAHIMNRMNVLTTLLAADKHYKTYQEELLDDNDKMNAYIVTQKIKVLLESI